MGMPQNVACSPSLRLCSVCLWLGLSVACLVSVSVSVCVSPVSCLLSFPLPLSPSASELKRG
eukprot:3566857-Rhodomonas_salina.3